MSGRESRRRPWRRGPLIWLLVIAETAALAVSVAIAVHGGGTGAVTDFYWLALDPSPASRPPGLHGLFTQGQAAPFPAAQAPCAPSP